MFDLAPPAAAPPCVVVLSANPRNLVACARALFERERLEPSRLIVVDDGARAEAEAQLPTGIRWIAGAKPFIFARNANLGIAAAGAADVVLLNDDAILTTPRGISLLAEELTAWPEVGICSAAVVGAVNNPRQHPQRGAALRIEPERLAFVAVYLRRAMLEQLGPLDEQFTGYGFEDDDLCIRARRAAWRLATFDGCTVDHTGLAAPSTFRSSMDWTERQEQNRRRFSAKWLGYFQHSRPEVRSLLTSSVRRVLDVGCGAGALGAALKAERPGVIVEGIEPDPPAAELAAAQLDRVHAAPAELAAPHLDSGAYDAIVFADVLEHLPDPGHVLSLLRLALAPGGEIVISVPNVRHWSVLRQVLEGRWTYEDAGILDRTHLRFFTRRSAVELLATAGYAVELLAAVPLGDGPPPSVALALAAAGLDVRNLDADARIYQWLIRARPADPVTIAERLDAIEA